MMDHKIEDIRALTGNFVLACAATPTESKELRLVFQPYNYSGLPHPSNPWFCVCHHTSPGHGQNTTYPTLEEAVEAYNEI